MQNNSLHYAGFWIRLLASLIDTLLLIVIITPILFAIYGKTYWQNSSAMHGPLYLFLTWIFPVAAILIFWFTKSATPGKMLLGLKIVDANTGKKPSAFQFIIRYLGYYISALVFFLGFLWIALDERKQGWHDKIARTVVIHERNKTT